MLNRREPLSVLKLYPEHDGTLPGVLASRTKAGADQPFMLYRGRTWTRGEFEAATIRLARSLAARGIRSGDRVGVMARNHEGHVLLLFALARLNATMVPTNPEFGVDEARYVFEKAAVSAVAVTPETVAVAREAVQGIAPAPWCIGFDDSGEGTIGLQALIAADAQADLPAPDAKAPCLIIFTSGTTGFPKGAMHSQANFVIAGEANVARLWLQPEDRVLTVLPLFHVNALFYSLAGSLAAGACFILLERFSASTFWETAVETGATTLNFIEAIGRILKARPRSEFRPEHRIESVYGARLDIQQCFREEFHVPHLLTGFGMTEIPGVCCVPWDGPQKAGSMGPIGRHPDPSRPWAKARVVDDEGRDVPDGTIGEFWVQHPIVMLGYFRDPEQTAATFEGPWFKTGDLVKRDPDGCFWFITRKKDIIRRRGENISGAELDRVIGSHPAVFEAAVIPVPSELGEDEILACVVKRPGHAITEEDVRAWCAERLAAMKVPRFVLFVDELPHTPTHKIAKQVLKNDGARLKARAVDFQAPGR